MHGNFQRVAVDDGDGVVGVQQIAESGRAARFGQAALDAVAGHAQRQGADLGLIVADAPAIPLDDELGVGRAGPEIWILSFLVVTVTGGHKYFISIVKAISISVNLLI